MSGDNKSEGDKKAMSAGLRALSVFAENFLVLEQEMELYEDKTGRYLIFSYNRDEVKVTMSIYDGNGNRWGEIKVDCNEDGVKEITAFLNKELNKLERGVI